MTDSFVFTFLPTAFSFNPPTIKFMNFFKWKRAAVVYDFLTDEGAKVKVSILSIYGTGQNDDNSLSHIRNWKEKSRAKWSPYMNLTFKNKLIFLCRNSDNNAMAEMDVCLFATKEVSISLSLLWLALQVGEVKRVLCSHRPIADQFCSVSKAGNGTRSLSVWMDLDFAPTILFNS